MSESLVKIEYFTESRPLQEKIARLIAVRAQFATAFDEDSSTWTLSYPKVQGVGS